MRILDKFKDKKVFIFDFDMTLVDSSWGIITCFILVLNKFKYMHKEEQIRRTFGMELKQAFRELTWCDDEQRIKEMCDAFVCYADKYMTEKTSWFPYSTRLLIDLKYAGKQTVIVSSKLKRRIEEFLTKMNDNHLIDLIIGGDDVEEYKPSPEGIEKVISQLGVKNDDVLYIGDTVIDEQTAKNASVDFVGVLTGPSYVCEFDKSTMLIKDLGEFLYYL